MEAQKQRWGEAGRRLDLRLRRRHPKPVSRDEHSPRRTARQHCKQQTERRHVVVSRNAADWLIRTPNTGCSTSSVKRKRPSPISSWPTVITGERNAGSLKRRPKKQRK